MFSYLSVEERVPADHPLRVIRPMTDEALRALSARFARLYSRLGRPSIPPEKLLRALLLQVFYSVRSERMLIEQLNYNLLFRWFVGLNLDESVWDATVFSKNRDRLLEGDIAQALFDQVLAQAKSQDLLSNEHFTVEGTLLEAWASMKSYQKKADPPERGKRHARARVASGYARVHHRPGSASVPQVQQRAVSAELSGACADGESHGSSVAACVTTAAPQGEWEAAAKMAAAVNGGTRRITLAADKAYDEARLLETLRALQVTPHVQQNQSERRSSNLDGRTTRHPGYAMSLQQRKRIERIFGWLKTTALMRKLRHRGKALVGWTFTLAVSAYNLVRLGRMAVQSA